MGNRIPQKHKNSKLTNASEYTKHCSKMEDWYGFVSSIHGLISKEACRGKNECQYNFIIIIIDDLIWHSLFYQPSETHFDLSLMLVKPHSSSPTSTRIYDLLIMLQFHILIVSVIGCPYPPPFISYPYLINVCALFLSTFFLYLPLIKSWLLSCINYKQHQ